MTDTLLEIRGLWLEGQSEEKWKPIINGVDLTLKKGEVLGLIGESGAGKSTLFKAIMGFVPAAKGEITVLGMPVKDALHQNIVAYVPQSEEVDWSFPVLVEDVVMMGR